MERINTRKPTGLTSMGLRTWGMIFLVLGIIGRGIVQNRVLGVGVVSVKQLVETMQSSNQMWIFATVSLVLQALETVAVPIFCFLLVEGFSHTSDYKNYILRVSGLALLSEVPYNLAMSNKFIDVSGRNPVFSLVLCLVILYYFKRYSGRSVKTVAIKILVIFSAVIWSGWLKLEGGAACVLLTSVLWGMKKKPIYRNMFGSSVAALCCVFSPFYLFSPLAFLIIHYYNGERGDGKHVVNYLVYPGLLMIAIAAAYFLLK